MKTFKRFLIESTASETVLKEVASYIKAECSEWLSKSGGQLVWRGTKRKGEVIPYFKENQTAADAGAADDENSYQFFNEPALILPTRQDRQPRDSALDNHNRLNNGLNKAFGKKFRSAAVFASPSKTIADAYAKDRVYAIFPRGACDFVWSDIFFDAFVVHPNAHMLTSMYDNNASPSAKARYLKIVIKSAIASLPEIPPILQKLADRYEYPRKFYSVLLNGYDGAYVLTDEELAAGKALLSALNNTEKATKILDYMIEHFTQDLYFLNRPIPSNLETEIMISCNDYIAVPATWAEQLNKFLR